MAAAFEPPSSAHLKFSLRRREEGEPPLDFRSSLLALARAAYPDPEGAALDSLALERLLSLARELRIALTIAAETHITLLRVAQNIQANLALRQSPGVAACAGVPVPVGAEAPQGEDVLPALAVGDRRGGGAGGRQPEQQWQARAPRSQGSAPAACFRCGQQGHIALGCHNGPRVFNKDSSSSPGSTSASATGPKASHDASITRPLPHLTHRAGFESIITRSSLRARVRLVLTRYNSPSGLSGSINGMRSCIAL
ncbi:unnamed protein product [Lampetra planeri]